MRDLDFPRKGGFFERLGFYRFGQPVGWEYQNKFTSIFGLVPLNTGGFLNVDTNSTDRKLVFNRDAILVRLDLTVSITGNTAPAMCGAAIVRNLEDGNYDPFGNMQIILGTITTKQDAVITKTMTLTPWTGMKFRPNGFISLGVMGDNIALVNCSFNAMFLTAPGDILET